MARVANPQVLSQYYCHQCQCRITPNLDDFTCPTCHGGFVEELRNNHPNNRRVPDSPVRLDAIQNALESMFAEADFESNFAEGSEDSSDYGYDGPTTRARHNRNRHGNSRTRTARRSRTFRTVPTGLFTSFPLLELQNSPSRDMFEVLITHLMNAGPNGPPPASDADIANLTKIKLTSEQLQENEKCSVCFDDYSLDEECVKLACDHIFHEPCIATWLKRHGTCPVCRKDLQGRMPSQRDPEYPAGDPDSATFTFMQGGPGSSFMF